MPEAPTIPLYVFVENIEEFVKNLNDLKEHLSDWLEWWTARKEHIFRAFKPTTAE